VQRAALLDFPQPLIVEMISLLSRARAFETRSCLDCSFRKEIGASAFVTDPARSSQDLAIF
jgi:hypothetical protein